jgi:superfamily I DNA/RNA helicase
VISAYAGTGKTTTLVSCVAPALAGSGPCLAVAFNKKIKDELEKRMPAYVNVKTMNGLGHSAWGSAIGKRLTLDDKKLGRLVSALVKDQGLCPDTWANIRALVSRAQQAGLIPNKFPQRSLLTDDEGSWSDLADELYIDGKPELFRAARAVLISSIMEAYQGTVSFDDQIYMSALFGGMFPRYPVVIVDEAQDLSPLNHIMIQKSAADRLIVAGDARQSIYTFRGAAHDSIERLMKLRPIWKDLPLTLTFRCPTEVVARQQTHAPGYAAAPSNLLGSVHKFPAKPEGQEPSWTWEELQSLASGQIAILCRNNGPLLFMAFKLIAQRIPPVMLGREIGKGLVKLSQKIMPQDSTPIAECRTLICDWRDTETSLALANGKEERIAGIHDRAECLFAVLGATPQPQNAKEFRAELEALFSRTAGWVTLSSIHKAKGLEFDTVVHLDPWRIPSKFALKRAALGDNRELLQEKNLQYVCETRTKDVLVLASLDDFS